MIEFWNFFKGFVLDTYYKFVALVAAIILILTYAVPQPQDIGYTRTMCFWILVIASFIWLISWLIAKFLEIEQFEQTDHYAPKLPAWVIPAIILWTIIQIAIWAIGLILVNFW